MLSRRSFLNRVGVAGAGCLSVGSLAPRWWGQVAAAAEQANSGRRLIVIELQGGNDGLNTVVPFADDAYYRARPTLAVKTDEVIKLDDHLGLHPAMKSWRPLWDEGQLSIVENCGYPQPNRSHFESMAIWHAGTQSPATSGWLGRAADQCAAGDLCYIGEGTVPHALSRRQRSVTSLSRLDDLKLRKDVLPVTTGEPDGTDDLAAIFATQLKEAQALSGQLPATAPDSLALLTGGSNARRVALSGRLGVVRTLIERDQPFRVYYTAIDGFDTHADQGNTHSGLLRQVTEAVSGFFKDLKSKKLADGVSVFLFSEFGRRVQENGSRGTDHGAAAPVFLLGDGVRGGIQGGVPNLADLDDGDVRFQIDFRDVYAGVLRGALGIDPTPALGQRDGALKLFS